MLFPMGVLAQEQVTRIEGLDNVITPNGDGLNDKFEVKLLPHGAKVSIYNRWGELMAEWNSPTDFWDGSTRDKNFKVILAPAGVYYYSITFFDENYQTGTVTLIR